LFLLRFCQASDWWHNSSSQAVAVRIFFGGKIDTALILLYILCTSQSWWCRVVGEIG